MEEEKRVLLVTPHRAKEGGRREYLKDRETRSLVDTLGYHIVMQLSPTLKEENRNTYIGPGQAGEVRDVALSYDPDLVIFDSCLTPREEKNLEEVIGYEIMDRESLIISIFEENAHSKEAKLELEKARLEYLKPRIQNRNASYSQQRGGVRGAKGSGERETELLRRNIDRYIFSIERELEKIKRQREAKRKERERSELFSFALTGYTNSGKSSLLNLLTGSDVLAEDKLFATLDTTVRRLMLPGGQEVLLSDTVGFVSDLPHSLVNAFSSTLEEALSSTKIIIVLDLSHPDVEMTYEVTKSTLEELGAFEKVALVVLNKADQIDNDISYSRLRSLPIRTVTTSVKEKSGIDELLNALEEISMEAYGDYDFTLPLGKGLWEYVRKGDLIKSVDYQDEIMIVHMRCRKSNFPYYASIVEKIKAPDRT